MVYCCHRIAVSACLEIKLWWEKIQRAKITHSFVSSSPGVGHLTTERIINYKRDGKRVLDVGCGNRKIKGAYGIDSSPMTQADKIFDLENPWKLGDASFDEVFCLNLLEHTLKFNHILNEIYRVLKKGGIAHVEVPYYNSYNYGRVPFHFVNFAESTLDDFFCEGGQFLRYSKARFKVIEKEFFSPNRRS